MARHPQATYRPYSDYDADRAFGLCVEKEWGLRVACWDCGHKVDIAPETLVRRFGEGCTPAKLQPRLACSACQCGRVHVYIISMPGHRIRDD